MAACTPRPRTSWSALPAAPVYAALLDPLATATWRVPDDMTARVSEWEPVPGGRFRVSLTYRAEDRTGKTEGATDTYSGEFDELVPDEQVVERIEFETDDPDLSGADDDDVDAARGRGRHRGRARCTRASRTSYRPRTTPPAPGCRSTKLAAYVEGLADLG